MEKDDAPKCEDRLVPPDMFGEIQVHSSATVPAVDFEDEADMMKKKQRIMTDKPDEYKDCWFRECEIDEEEKKLHVRCVLASDTEAGGKGIRSRLHLFVGLTDEAGCSGNSCEQEVC